VSGKDPHGTGDFRRDFEIDKPGIVGARWWNQSLKDEGAQLARRNVLKGLAVAGGMVAAVSMCGVGVATLLNESKEATALSKRRSLDMQKEYGWDFGARGQALVFDGVAEGPFDRSHLQSLSAVTSPSSQGPNAKYHVPTLAASLFATPSTTLPDPEDGQPAPDAAPFKALAAVLVPVVTPAMTRAYHVGEAVARLAARRKDVAVLVDLPGPEAVAFAAGAAEAFEPVMLLDNWPHPHGVVASHLTLAALAYYQPRFAAQRFSRTSTAPCFVLDRSRLAAYSEATDRFDNRYYARMPKLAMLAKDGIGTLLYVVAAPSSLPEPADLNDVLSARGSGVDVRALSLVDFDADPAAAQPERMAYGGSARSDGRFWTDYSNDNPPTSTTVNAAAPARHYLFGPRPATVMPTLGMVAVVATTSGLVLAAALDRRGSMNRFSGGWSG
jgi:hypothetical protein